MSDNYSIDTRIFSIDKFRLILKTKDILPGRIILNDILDERFDLLKNRGIESLFDLLETLKTKTKIEKFSIETGLSIEYLTILRREANSYISVPMKLCELPSAETIIIEKLIKAGIKDTKQLLLISEKQSEREKLADKCNVPIDKLKELVQLCDILRITGVGPVFARIIYDSGIHSVKDFISIEKEVLFEMLLKTNKDKELTKAKFTIKDIHYCIELSKFLPLIIEN